MWIAAFQQCLHWTTRRQHAGRAAVAALTAASELPVSNGDKFFPV